MNIWHAMAARRGVVAIVSASEIVGSNLAGVQVLGLYTYTADLFFLT
jgi:hypothetical protein